MTEKESKEVRDMTINDKVTKIFNAEGFPVLGWMVLQSTKTFTIEMEQLRTTLNDAGIDPTIVRDQIAKNVATRAVREAAKDHSLGFRQFHKKIIDNGDKSAWAIAHGVVDEAKEQVDFETNTTAVFDKDIKTLKATGTKKNEIEGLFNKIKDTYTDGQFRTIVTRYLLRVCSSIAVREQGGIYFVPSIMEAELVKLVKVFEELGKDRCDITLIPIVNTESARHNVAKSTSDQLKEEVEGMQADLEGLGDQISPKMLEIRMAKYNDLRAKIEGYEDLLQFKAEELKEGLTKITDDLKKKLL